VVMAGLCVSATCVLNGCAVTKDIPYRQVIYKATYNYLRAAECQNNAKQQMAYEPCVKSYAADYESYRQMRERYVRRVDNEDKSS
jgi:hypothetical protein